MRESLRERWESRQEQPFWRLVQLFVERIFRGGGDADSDGLDMGIGLVLMVLALPGGFVSILLFDKYGSLLQWLRGQTHVDTLMIAFPDEYFFIVLAMTVTGAVAVWRWDAIFPDRRDYGNLVHLPISMCTIFFANLTAVLFLVGLVAIDVNAASCVLFPMVVAASQAHFGFFLTFAAIHGVAVVLASVFAFLAVFSVIGVLMAALPARILRRASAYIRGLVVVYLVTMLCTSFAVPTLLRRVTGPAPAWTYALPSTWFVSLCQSLRGRATPAMAELARLPLPALAALVVLALAMYAIGYRRHFVRIAEMADGATVLHHGGNTRIGVPLERFWLRTPFQRAGFRFVSKTLVRSEAHRLALTGVSGLALVLASQAMLDAFDGAKSLRQAALSADALSIPFMLTFLTIVGLRVIFEIPVELRANWIFQFTLDRDRQECEALARRVILAWVLPAILIVTFVAYLDLAGLRIALLHTFLVAAWAVLLTNILLTRFRKIPFACTLPVFKQHSIVILISFAFGFLIYAVSTPDFEAEALLDPILLLKLLPVAWLAWYVPHRLAKNTTEIERKLIFEEPTPRTVQALGLSE